MNQAKPTIRLFVPGEYAPGQTLLLGKNQSHYLASVMRAKAGDVISLFNGSDGEWSAGIVSIDKKSVNVELTKQQKKHKPSPDLWIAFAPIKNKTDLVVEKATELGVAKILFVPTMHSVVKTVNMEKMQAHAIEAAEQCERHDIPAIETVRDLATLLGNWPKDRILLYGDESGSGEAMGGLLRSLSPRGGGAGRGQESYAILIGPEGGFSKLEHQMLAAAPFVKPFGMGPRILRADTAAVAALACLQSQLGDWHHKPHFQAVS